MNKIIKRNVLKEDCHFTDDMHPLLQRVYAARGIQNEDELDYDLKHLLSFTSLKNIDVASAYLCDAIKQQKRLLIIGDFDADGATSTAVAMSALRAFGANHVAYLVPNRFEYGYGLTPAIVAVAQKWKPDVIITVDNGISSIDGVNAANQAGIDVIVTDHHLPAAQLPQAVAIINPNQPNDAFPSKHCAGVGVIFYVMCALRRALIEDDWFTHNNIVIPNMSQLLDLVALGTVADVVPLDRNNRILVHQGLQRIRSAQTRPGILALLKVAKRNIKQLTSIDFAYAIGPRLNAAGRLDDMSLGIECLLCDNKKRAFEYASELDTLNQERRSIEADMQQEALADLDDLAQSTLSMENAAELPLGLCLYQAHWHQGVIGILAGRIKDQMYRPVIAFATDQNDHLKGSARSIPGVHIRDLLDRIASQHPDLITKFGGHAMAAGLSITKNNLTRFSEIFNQTITEIFEGKPPLNEIITDGGLAPDELTYDVARFLKEAGPWGQAFPEPLFDGLFKVLQQRIVAEKHIKLILQIPDTHRTIDAIYFNAVDKIAKILDGDIVHLAYRLDANEFQGYCTPQLIVEYLEVKQ